MNNTRKFLTASLTALTLVASVAATATPAQAKYGRNAAFFGGLAVGALALGALGASSYGSPAYASSCYFDRQPVTNRWGDVIGYRRVRICD